MLHHVGYEMRKMAKINTRHRRRSEPEQTRIAKCVRRLARRKNFSTEDIRVSIGKVAPGTLSSTLAKMRDLGYLVRCRDKTGQARWKALRLLREDGLEEIVKAVNKYSSLLSVMYRFRIDVEKPKRKAGKLAPEAKIATLLKMLEEQKERAKSRHKTLTRVYNAIASLQ